MDLNTILLIIAAIAAAGFVAALALSRALWWQSALIVTVLCGFGGSLGMYGLNLGLDLAGGTSLLYEVEVPENVDAETAIADTIAVLKERVDPTGVRNLNWRQEGSNRIEVQMPRPKPAVVQLQQRVRELEQQIRDRNISAAQALAVASLDDPRQFEQQAAQLAAGIDVRVELLQQIRDLRQQIQQTRAQLAEADPGSAAEVDLGNELQQLDGRYQQREGELLATRLSIGQLQEVIGRPDAPGQGEELSPRQRGLDELRQAHPTRVKEINEYAQVYGQYIGRKQTFDDPEDLKQLISAAGVLEFRITVLPAEAPDAAELRQQLRQGQQIVNNGRMKWIEIRDISMFAGTAAELAALRTDPATYFTGRGMVGAEYGEGQYYILTWNTPERSMLKQWPEQAGWEVQDVGRTLDRSNFPAVSLALNAKGSRVMSRLSADHVGRQMAMVLDDRLLSAPTIQGPLAGDIQISGGEGGFTRTEQNFLVKTLSAGSLRAQVSPEPVAEKTIGPSLGQDNLDKGMEAARDALIGVAVFMIAYYFFSGGVAAIALLANIVIILGYMSLLQAAFTLPGIAGIVLTIGMCVDANVLIFERIREELNRGADGETALRLGYQKAFSSIIDSNITNLIVCLILYQTATVEVRGFALTLGAGIVATLFTSLFMTRVIFKLWAAGMGHGVVRQQLPSVAPAVDRALTPSIRWIGKKPIFFAVSIVLVVGSWVLVASRGVEMLDIEFRAGTRVTLELAEDRAMTLAQARDEVRHVAEIMDAPADSLEGEDAALALRLRELVEQRRVELSNERLAEAREEADPGEQIDEQAIRDDVDDDTNLVALRNATVVSVGEPVAEADDGARFRWFAVESTIEDDRVVRAALGGAFADQLRTRQPLTVDQARAYARRDVPRRSALRDAIETLRGDMIVHIDLDPASEATAEDVRERIEAGRYRLTQFRQFTNDREYQVAEIGYRAGGQFLDEFAVVIDTASPVERDQAAIEAEARRQMAFVTEALARTQSQSVDNFTSSVARTLRDRAVVAVLLSLLAIVAYIWFRFGSLRYGLAAITALVHDVSIALGCVAVTHYLFQSAFGEAFKLDAFKLNLGLIAALLTIIGYSLNDTIVLFDRIRENRGKLAYASTAIIDQSINQTISRTLLTSLTTLLAVGMMYWFGGEGIRGFAFALIIGVLIGTYSSIAVAAPLLTLGTSKGPSTTSGARPDIEREPSGHEIPDEARGTG